MRALRSAHGTAALPPLLSFLEALPAWRSARSIAGYCAIRGELGVGPLLDDARARGVRVALPRIESSSGGGTRLAFHPWAGEPLLPGAYGIPEPLPSPSELPPASFDLLFVPGLAFDRAGRRLGQGGGFYDRILAARGPGRDPGKGIAIGIAWAWQVIGAVPVDPWDQPVDHLLTDTGGIDTGGIDTGGIDTGGIGTGGIGPA